MIPEKNIKDFTMYIYQCVGVALKEFLKTTEESKYLYYKPTLFAYLDVLQQLIKNYEFKSPEDK